MLRLLHVGLNTEDDAQIYIKNSIFETLMGFYSSPLSDDDSKELIIQVRLGTSIHIPVFSLFLDVNIYAFILLIIYIGCHEMSLLLL